MGKLYETANSGQIFVLTAVGFEKTPDPVKQERSVGKPVPLFEKRVPPSWIQKGYVVKVELT